MRIWLYRVWHRLLNFTGLYTGLGHLGLRFRVWLIAVEVSRWVGAPCFIAIFYTCWFFDTRNPKACYRMFLLG